MQKAREGQGQARVEVWIAAAVFAAIAYSRLECWDDPSTLQSGIVVEGLLAAVSRWATCNETRPRRLRCRDHLL